MGPAGLEPAKAYASGFTARPLCRSGHDPHVHATRTKPTMGFEPMTDRLQGGCSAETELRWRATITTATPHFRYARRLPSANRG